MAKFKIPNAAEYEAHLGISNPQQRIAVLRHMRRMMRILQSVRKRNAEIFYAEYPRERRICDSCAFAPATYRRKGFLATVYGLMLAVHGKKRYFMCHANQPGHESNEIDTRRLIPCVGFVLVKDNAEAKCAAATAYEEVERELANGKTQRAQEEVIDQLLDELLALQLGTSPADVHENMSKPRDQWSTAFRQKMETPSRLVEVSQPRRRYGERTA